MSNTKNGGVPKKGSLEKKWGSYTGTGITSERGKDCLALREGVGGGEFAIVKLFGGPWTNSKMKVIEELKVSSLEVAHERFKAVSKKLGFKQKPLRTAGLLAAYL